MTDGYLVKIPDLGERGLPGSRLLEGAGAPSPELGNDHDWYIRSGPGSDTQLYGPKLAGVWGAGRTLRGGVGSRGLRGWSPLIHVVPDGARRVHMISGWTGGEGDPPPSGLYLSSDGLTVNLAEAEDVRGAPGLFSEGDPDAMSFSSEDKLPIVADGMPSRMTLSQLLMLLSVQPGYLHGLGCANAVDANHDITVQVGRCASDDAAPVLMTLGAAITKKMDETFTEGDGAGGMADGEVLPVSGVVHVWAISKADGGVDVMGSNHASSGLSPALPVDFVAKRRILSVLTDASANIRPFAQIGDEVLLLTQIDAVNASNPGSSVITRNLPVPLGFPVRAILNIRVVWASSGAGRHSFWSPFQGNPGSTPVGSIETASTGGNWSSQHRTEITTNDTGQIMERHSASATNDNVQIAVLGWRDRRGRD